MSGQHQILASVHPPVLQFFQHVIHVGPALPANPYGATNLSPGHVVEAVLVVVVWMIGIGMRSVIAKNGSTTVAEDASVVLAVIEAHPRPTISLHDVKVDLDIDEEIVQAGDTTRDSDGYGPSQAIMKHDHRDIMGHHEPGILERLEAPLMNNDGVAEFVPAVAVSGRQGAGAS